MNGVLRGNLSGKNSLFQYWIPAVVAFSICLPIRLNAIVSLTAFVVYLGYALATGTFRLGFFRTVLFTLIAIQFLIQALGILHATDMRDSLHDLERLSYALMFPLLIYLFGEHKVTAKQLVGALVAGALLLVGFGLVYVVFAVDAPQRSVILSQGHEAFTDFIGIHPTYLSIYLTFGFFFVLEGLRTRIASMTRWNKAMSLIQVLLIACALLFLRSQLVLIIWFILSVVYIIIIFKRRAAIVTFFLFTFGFLAYLLDTSRVSTFFDTYGKNVSTALDNRIKIWTASGIAIKSSPWIGAGTGNEQVALSDAYEQLGFQEGINNQYNAHNQYLEFLVRNGLPELVVFLVLMFYSFRQSLKANEYTFLIFNMIMSLCMIAESCLNVHKGIVFFYFFLSAFVYLPYSSRSRTDLGVSD